MAGSKVVAGGATGSIIGDLVESGTSKENAALYAEVLRWGGAVVTAKVADYEAAKYKAIMSRKDFDITVREGAYVTRAGRATTLALRPTRPTRYDANATSARHARYPRQVLSRLWAPSLIAADLDGGPLEGGVGLG
jgi:hypothetical protein